MAAALAAKLSRTPKRFAAKTSGLTRQRRRILWHQLCLIAAQRIFRCLATRPRPCFQESRHEDSELVRRRRRAGLLLLLRRRRGRAAAQFSPATEAAAACSAATGPAASGRA